VSSFSNKDRRILLFLFLAVLVVTVAAFLRKKAWVEVSREFPQIGTLIEIKVPCPPEREKDATVAIQDARDEIKRLESLMSAYLPNSDISRVNKSAAREPVKISNETFDVVQQALTLSEKTEGAFDITFASVGKLWSLKPEAPRIPTDEAIRAALPLVNYKNVILDEKNKTIRFAHEGMEISLGGIAKTTAIEWAVNAIKKRGFNDALVNAGGDVYALGLNANRRPWRVGIFHPREQSKFITKIDVTNRAVFTSGDYERFVDIGGKRYHHILDPRTGRPADKCISVTVVTPDLQTVRGLSASIFILGPDEGMKLIRRLPGVEALIVTPDMHIYATEFFRIPNGEILR